MLDCFSSCFCAGTTAGQARFSNTVMEIREMLLWKNEHRLTVNT